MDTGVVVAVGVVSAESRLIAFCDNDSHILDGGCILGSLDTAGEGCDILTVDHDRNSDLVAVDLDSLCELISAELDECCALCESLSCGEGSLDGLVGIFSKGDLRASLLGDGDGLEDELVALADHLDLGSTCFSVVGLSNEHHGVLG